MIFDFFHSRRSANNRARVFGTEVEYGITSPSDPSLSPIRTSTDLVLSYATTLGCSEDTRTRWDFFPEHPLRDVRGYDLGIARPAPHINPNAPGMANIVLSNGGRFYVDHAHPEVSTPEVPDPLDIVLWDKAGERLAHRASEALASQDDGYPVKLYKNNVDGKGASYGAHENYLVSRSVDFDLLAANLIPFFVTRIVYTGAGRVGRGTASENPGFQLSQRADYMETDISLETTLNRGIINTRDEPHADEARWRRLHVIVGDANMSEVATFLKVGTTALVLDAIEGAVDFTDLQLADPVQSIKDISYGGVTTEVELANGTVLNALEIQQEYLSRVTSFLRTNSSSLSQQRSEQVIHWWSKALHDLGEDPVQTAEYLDWSAKLTLIDKMRERHQLEWDDLRLQALDINYSDISPSGIYNRLVARGNMTRLVSEEAVEEAMTTPPPSTRAWLRGTLVERFGSKILAANWDSLSVDNPDGSILTIQLSDPLAWGADKCESMLENESDPFVIVNTVAKQLKGKQ